MNKPPDFMQFVKDQVVAWEQKLKDKEVECEMKDRIITDLRDQIAMLKQEVRGLTINLNEARKTRPDNRGHC